MPIFFCLHPQQNGEYDCNGGEQNVPHSTVYCCNILFLFITTTNSDLLTITMQQVIWETTLELVVHCIMRQIFVMWEVPERKGNFNSDPNFVQRKGYARYGGFSQRCCSRLRYSGMWRRGGFVNSEPRVEASAFSKYLTLKSSRKVSK